jgi:hypothetical protein
MTWNVCSKEGNPLILISVDDSVPDGYAIECETSNPNYLIDLGVPTATLITNLAFRNRFTMSEKVTIDLASIDIPGEPENLRQFASSLRVFMRDLDNAKWVDLSRADTAYDVAILAEYGLIASGRDVEILTTPPTDVELYHGMV